MKKILMIITLTVSRFTSYSQQITSDSSQSDLRKNVIHAQVGFAPELYLAYNLSYERMLFDIRKGILNSIWAKVGFGGWGTFFGFGGEPLQKIGVSMLSGSGGGHIEIMFGMVRIYDRKVHYDASYYHNLQNVRVPIPTEKSDYVDFEPSVVIGYRFQKLGGHFVFRFGTGYPEAIYLGLGVAF